MGEVKYGHRYGPQCLVEGAIGASEVFKFLGGGWVKSDGSNRLEVAGSGDTELIGWFQTTVDFTASSTEGQDKGLVDISCNSVYRMPSDAAAAATDMWETCDLIVASNIQKADVGESNEDVIQIVGFDATNVTVDVRMNPAKMGSVGVI